MTELNFDGRVAVITGAGRGLGRSYARLLASRGANVVVNDIGAGTQGTGFDAGPAEAVVAEIVAAGGQAVASTDSVATAEGGEAIIRAAIETFGRIDILIHNAGNVRSAPLREMSYKDFDNVLDVHLRGAFHVVRPAFPLMCDAGYGRVVLTSSINGLYGRSENANYNTAKAGLIGLSHTIAVEGAGSGVKSNVIVPAALTRLAEGKDASSYPPMDAEMVAPAVAWLAHEACSISGEMLVSMGGRVARAYTAESRGAYRPSWDVEGIAANIDQIRALDGAVVFEPLPDGHREHLLYGFGMAGAG